MVPFVVVVREGCTVMRRSRLIIYDSESKLLIFMYEWGFELFLIK